MDFIVLLKQHYSESGSAHRSSGLSGMITIARGDGEQSGDPLSIEFCYKIGLDYVSCSPFRVPVARLSAAQATLNLEEPKDKYRKQWPAPSNYCGMLIKPCNSFSFIHASNWDFTGKITNHATNVNDARITINLQEL